MNKIIDCHSHTMTNRILNDYMKKCQEERILIVIRGDLPLFKKDYYDFNISDWHNIVKQDNIYAIECIDMDKDVGKQLKYIEGYIKTTNKVVGIKLYPGYQYFYPTDQKTEKIYKFAEKNNLVVVFHTGDVLDEKNHAILKYAKACHIDEVAVKHPNVKFVLSHLGFPDILETAMIINKNKNVYTCISGLIDVNYEEDFLGKDLKKAITYYPSIINKIMHGTDYCGENTILNKIEEYKVFVNNNFNKDDANKIFYENAYNLYIKNKEQK